MSPMFWDEVARNAGASSDDIADTVLYKITSNCKREKTEKLFAYLWPLCIS
jgi:hypothetical protein